MEFRNRTTGEIVDELTLRRGFDGSLPTPLNIETLDFLGVDPILISPRPEDTLDTTFIRDGVEENDLGQWVEKWSPVERTPEELDEATTTAREQKWEAIKALREQRKEGGVLIDGNWFHTDASSKIQILSLMMMGANIPEGIQWKTMDNQFVPINQQSATAIFQGMVAREQAIFANAERHRAAMLESENPQAYDFSGGWPQSFEEATGDVSRE